MVISLASIQKQVFSVNAKFIVYGSMYFGSVYVHRIAEAPDTLWYGLHHDNDIERA
jgi:hypothetical protein